MRVINVFQGRMYRGKTGFRENLEVKSKVATVD